MSPADRSDKMQKVAFHHDPRNSGSSGTMNSILLSYPSADPYSSQQQRSNSQPYVSQPGAPTAAPLGAGLVSYDLPSFIQVARRPDQRLCANLDDASDSRSSDIQFSALTNSKVEDSTIISSQLTGSFVYRGCNIFQSTLKSSLVGENSDVASCSVENSSVMNSKVTSCTILNSQILEGQHVGRTFINTRITGNEPPGNPARSGHGVEMDLENGNEG